MSIHDSPGSMMGHEALPSDDGSWNFMDVPTANSESASPSVAFLPSPASRSLASYGVVAHIGQGVRGLSSSPGSGSGRQHFHLHGHNHSPEPLAMQLPPTSSPSQQAALSGQQQQQQQQQQPRTSFSGATQQLASAFSLQFPDQVNIPLDMTTNSLDASSFVADSQFSLTNPDAAELLQFQNTMLFDQQIRELTGYYSTNLSPTTPALQSGFVPALQQQLQQQQSQQQQRQQQQTLFRIPSHLQSGANVPPWNHTSVPEAQEPNIFVMDGPGLGSLSPESISASVSGNASISQSASPRSLANNQIEAEQPSQQQPLPWSSLEQFGLQDLQHILQLQQAHQQAQQQGQQMQQLQQGMHQGQQLQQPQQLQSSQFTLLLPPGHMATDPMPMALASTPAAPETKFSPPHSSSRPIPSRLAHSSSINKVRGSGTRVTKKKASAALSDKLQLSGSADSSSSDDRFVIFTPKTISTHAGTGSRFNPFECFEAMSATQKGRKGPLAEEVKESALQVRRAGACFCCHSRKVKCDAQLPCKNCIKLATHLPQAMCWRFDDFLGPLFPTLIRSHFRKDVMATFISDNIGAFSSDTPHTIHLSSGMVFKSTLEIRNVRTFQPPPTSIALTHAHLKTANDQIQLSIQNSLPVALDLTNSSAVGASLQQEKIKKTLRTYVDAIIKEDAYIDTVTARLQGSELPKTILTITRDFYLKTSSPIVKQALYIYTMQYMMMHHLVFTEQSLKDLPLAGHVFSSSAFQTSRLLNRQIKAILDELMQEEVDKLFRMFTRELKPKARMAWATCLAAFLVFCLFMESTGLSVDYYVITENQISLDNCRKMNPAVSRKEAVRLSRELENLPFRQFAFQFHNIYQTHQQAAANNSHSPPSSSSSSTSSPAASGSSGAAPTPSGGSTSSIKASFNPLVDDAPLLSGDLDKHAQELVTQLRTLLSGESWSELDFLAFDLLLDTVETHPYPRDVSLNYTGRLCSKFLLSFQNQDYIFTPA
ncbi:hypothetical protein SCUCBS95973_002527 [Sporothrix curviconia]|uniref:Zn(2)-C6 fungal-type domain-containing protein n=1 Tax=Sporothrix curviconia TaxID=1260050 RepID=A0ABP0B7L0_9PEZI